MKVRVYRNLTKGGYTVMSRDTNRKVAVVTELGLKNVVFNVREGGRLKVIEEKQKNVHAFLEGELCDYMLTEHCECRVSYNPYLKGSFYKCDDNSDVDCADFVRVNEHGVFV
mgnify:CR=1 FL=1